MAPAISSLRPSAGPLLGLACGALLGVLLEKLRQEWCRGRWSAKDGKLPSSSKVSSGDVVRSGAEVRVSAAELRAAVAACLERAGAPRERAPLVADVLVAADERGVPSHGVNRAEMYCNELRNGLINGSADPLVSCETASTANIDGQNSLGAVVSKFAMELCIKKAKATGVGFVVCRNSNHFGIAGYWSRMALAEGLIGFAFTNTSPFMVPTRAATRAAGTNPIACFCPASGSDSFQLDMASTTVPAGKVEVCHRKGQALPHGWAVDRHGSITSAAEALLAGGLTPLGGPEETAGYKGYGLNMMIEILCAVLSGCESLGPDVPKWTADRGVKVDYGHCFICIDPEQVLPGGGFQDRLAKYLTRMRELPRADPTLAVAVPGDPERTAEARARQEGVPLAEGVAMGFRGLAEDLGCRETLPSQIRDLRCAAAPKHILVSGK